MIGIQILAILFVLWMSYFSYLHFRRHEYSLGEFLFWQILWLGLAFVTFFPASTRILLQTFSISRTFDFVIVVAIVVLFWTTFRNYILLRRTERRLEDLVRKITLGADHRDPKI